MRMSEARRCRLADPLVCAVLPIRMSEARRCRLADPLVSDMFRYLRSKEAHLPHYLAQSPQLSSRRYLVDWLAIVAERFDICGVSRHLAVALLDYFMDKFSITEPQLKLVVLGCLLIACKLEEQEINIPKSTTLNQFVPSPGYTPRDYISIELTILQHMDWKVQLPTAAHFIEYYLCCAVNDTDFHHGKQLGDQTAMAKDYMQKYCTYFLEVSLQDHSYRSHVPSLVACACIASSRLCLGIAPAWTHELQHTSGYQWHDMHNIVSALLHTHKLDSQGAVAESPATNLPSTPTCSQTDVVSPCSTDQGYHSLTTTPGSPSSTLRD